MSVENSRQVAGAAEAAGPRYFRKRQVGFQEQLFGPLQARPLNLRVDGTSQRLTKTNFQRAACVVQVSHNVVDPDGLPGIVVNEAQSRCDLQIFVNENVGGSTSDHAKGCGDQALGLFDATSHEFA
jgi:hypothetical protein